jgi:hypothetical protein
MRHITVFSILLAALVLAGGCIISDELTTITIQPDGSAEWVRFQSNVRSTEQGLKAEQELQKFATDFDTRQDADLVRIVEAGGEISDARWVRREKPFATLATAKFPTVEALKRFFTVEGKSGTVVAEPEFTSNGSRRKLSISIPVPADQPTLAEPGPTCEELLARKADSISETRIVVAHGHIVASQGFVVARDGQSAVFNTRQLEELLRQRPARIEIFLEWEVAGN